MSKHNEIVYENQTKGTHENEQAVNVVLAMLDTLLVDVMDRFCHFGPFGLSFGFDLA